MRTDERMTVDERRKYLKVRSPRYAKVRRGERSAPRTEMAAVTGLHRKSLVRLLHAPSLEVLELFASRPCAEQPQSAHYKDLAGGSSVRASAP